MILNLEHIKSIILDNPNKEIIQKGRTYNKTLRLHLYGEGLKDSMTKIEGYEKESLHALRVKYARSTKDLYSRLRRPIDKVYSARGGSTYYNLPESQDKQARALALNVRNGYSIRKWVETFWQPHALDDPFGLTFLEMLPIQEALLARQQGRSYVYPTYKSIHAIYDYLPKGSKLEYAVFNVSREEKIKNGIDEKLTVYRVVDDAFDYYVKKESGTVTILDGFTLPNYFGEVPAEINSDITDPAHEDCYLSFLDDVIELGTHYLLKGAIKLTHEFLHAYPKYWQYATACPTCAGTGYHEGQTCTSCNGSGKYAMTKVSDSMLLDMPGDASQKITPDVAGYVSPDKIYYEIATHDLGLLEDLMHYTLWGASSKIKAQGMSTTPEGQTNTATEEILDLKPQEDRLKVISEMAERKHKFILDSVVRLQVKPGYGGSSVSYGRRYMIEGPDAIWDKYSKARKDGSPVSVLDDLLIEYYETKYQSDEVALAIALKLMYVEPFVHFTSQVVDAMQSVGHEDKVAKAYFTEWLALVSDAEILSGDVVSLKTALTEYAKAKAVPDPAEMEKKEPTF